MKLIDKINFKKLGEKEFFKKLKLTPKAIRKLFSAVISLAVIAAIIAANIVVSALVERYPINLDLTSDGDYSATTLNDEENAEILEFIKGITNPISVTVCMGELDTGNGIYQTYMENQFTMSDTTGGKYYEQMKALVNSITKLNSNISLVYQSPLEPAFSSIQARFPDQQINYGSILVESTFTNASGTQITRQKIIDINDVYEVEDQTGYAEMGMGYYTIVGSNVEQHLTQALYYVTSEKSVYVANLTGHGCDSGEALTTLLEGNNYEFIDVADLLQGIDERCEFLVINAPSVDFTNEEIAIIEKFLTPDGEGLQQKSLVYISHLTASLPVFEEYMLEWGFDFYDEVVYSSVQGNFNGYYEYVQPKISTDGNNYLPDISEAKKFYYAPYRAFKLTDAGDSNASLLNFPEGYVGEPISEMKEDSTWTEDQATLTGQLEAVAVAVKQDTYGSGMSPSVLTSNVIAVGSTYLFNEAAIKSTAYANGNFTVGLFNNLSNLNENSVRQVEFVPKEIVTDSYADEIAGTNATALVNILFAIPAALAVTGVVVWVKRRRR